MNKPAPKRIGKLKLIQAGATELFQIIRTLIKLKMGWLIPAASVLLILAVLLALIAGTGPLAPFIYPLF